MPPTPTLCISDDAHMAYLAVNQNAHHVVDKLDDASDGVALHVSYLYIISDNVVQTKLFC